MNNIRTVSDTKRTFYTIHTRPVNSFYRRVVEELMVEMHLVSVNVNFRYDPIYALGVVTTFDRFMQGYAPEEDKVSIFHALIKAQEDEPQRYREDAQRLEGLASRLSAKELISSFSREGGEPAAAELQSCIQAIMANAEFKYSRLFAIGLFTLLESADSNLVKEEAQRTEALQKICAGLNLSDEKLGKDLDLYRSNLEKIAQARITLEDTLKAERKKREQRMAEKGVAANSDTVSEK